jgi:ribosome maturation factor RimP
MMTDDFQQYLGKRVKITLSNNYNFSGDVISISETTLSMKDKFGSNVTIRLSDILFVVEVSR